ncbi:MAG: AEC family transporter [Syntrophobacteraceae bacterium]
MSKVSMYVAETVIAFSLLVVAAYLLKRKGVLKQEDSAVFARLLTQAVLPATILYQLWTHRISGESVVPIMIIILTGTLSMVVSWLAGVLLKFDRRNIGALMIVSSFGSSALIGYPILQYAFADSPQALAEGIIISELGVGLPIFIFAPAVAMFFGGSFRGNQDWSKLARDYFLSPIFIAVVLGLVLSRIKLPSDMMLVDTIMEMLKMTEGALVVVAAVILGLQLSFQPLTGFWKLIAISLLIQMMLQPWFSGFLAGALNINAEYRQVLILITAMPAAILGPVFAARYDCAAKTAALLTFTHIIISPVLVPAVFALLS